MDWGSVWSRGCSPPFCSHNTSSFSTLCQLLMMVSRFSRMMRLALGVPRAEASHAPREQILLWC